MPHVITKSGLPVFFDEEDRGLVEAHTWRVERTGKKFYAISEAGYMHRMVLGLEKDDGQLGDHKNGCTVDNRRSNLRVVNDQQNCWNVRSKRKNETGYEGVSKVKGRYQARIYRDGARTSLGYFDTPEKAAEAYAIKHAEVQSRIMKDV